MFYQPDLEETGAKGLLASRLNVPSKSNSKFLFDLHPIDFSRDYLKRKLDNRD
jgi:hypothetical protein